MKQFTFLKSHEIRKLFYSRPKPSAFKIASLSLSCNFSLEEYDGSRSVLKQV